MSRRPYPYMIIDRYIIYTLHNTRTSYTHVRINYKPRNKRVSIAEDVPKNYNNIDNAIVVNLASPNRTYYVYLIVYFIIIVIIITCFVIYNLIFHNRHAYNIQGDSLNALSPVLYLIMNSGYWDLQI